MKNVKKLLKKAMVFTVAASMLVGTPLTASAAGIRGVYSVSDGTNDGIGDDKDTSHTGTVTNTDTNTNSGVIKDNDAKIIGIVLDKDYVNAEKGVKETLKATIVLDGDLVDKEGGDKTSEEILEQLESKIKWEVTYADGTTVKNNVAANKVLSIAATAADRTVVTLNPRQGTKAGEEMIVKATIDGSYRWYKDGEGNLQVEELTTNRTEDYTADAKVFIKEYSDRLWFDGNPETEAVDEMPQAYLKHTMDLSKYLMRDPETANDTITWISTNTKAATVTAAGVVTFKGKGTNASGSIIAVGERGGDAKAEWRFTVDPGLQASKVEIVDPTANYIQFEGNKTETDLGAGGWRDQDVDVVMYAKVNAAVDSEGKAICGDTVSKAEADLTKKPKKTEVQDGQQYVAIVEVEGVKTAVVKTVDVTDTITWTSNKPAIVSVAAVAPLDVENDSALLTANGVGKAVITAKASGGKSTKLNVTVKATLTDLTIDNEEDELYSGQSLQMIFSRKPEENKDGVKWSIAKVGKYNADDTPALDNKGNQKQMNHPNATINSKGVLTIKPKLNLSQDEYRTVTVVLQSKTTKLDENGNKVPVAEDSFDITIDQSSIDGILVKDDAGLSIADVRVIDGKVKVNHNSIIVNKSDNTTEISVPKNRTYTATVTPAAYQGNDPDQVYEAATETLTWKTSNAKVASIAYAADGTAKITANAKGTATITVSGIRVTADNKGKEKASVIKTTFKVSVKQPVKTITLNKPTVVLNEKVKAGQVQNQKVALKATLGPKGVDTKTAIHWSVKRNGTELEATKDLGLLDKSGNEITKASVSINLPAPVIGDVFEITARTDSGASAISTVTIVEKTDSVVIAEKELNAERKPVLFNGMDGKKQKDNVTNRVIGDTFKMYPCIDIAAGKSATDYYTAGTNNCENVTYSVNKKGIVTIDDDGTVHAIKNGTVTITAKTPLGKKGTLKVIVTID